MRLLKYAVIFSATGLALVGCGDSPTEQSAEEPNYFPMNEGDFWEYSYTATRVEPDTVIWEEGSRFSQVLLVSADTCKVETVTSYWKLGGVLLPDTSVICDTLTYLVTPDSILRLAYNELYFKILDFPLYPQRPNPL